MKLIPLTQGKFAQVDDDDFDWLNQWKWKATKIGNTSYATRTTTRNLRTTGKHATALMHRVILGLTDPKSQADHRDRNGLNNQRSNLRAVTKSQNGTNKKCVGRSGYLGVFPVSGYTDKWFARTRINNKPRYLGTFNSKKLAAQAYKNALIKIYGE